MKYLIQLSIVMALGASCKNTQNSAEISKEIPEFPSASLSQWQVLFDGSNFDQWRGYLSDSMPEAWSIQDSTMVFTPGANVVKILSQGTFTTTLSCP